MQIIGVDFSGAKTDNRTWIAQCSIDGLDLTIQSCDSVRRGELTNTLASMPSGTVAALDFPFSVPLKFASQYYPDAENMSDLWAEFALIELPEFVAMRDEFVTSNGEEKRVADGYYPESYSCLHKSNPNMLPMTFHGMRMLAQLSEYGFNIPPLVHEASGDSTLLEVMPGAVLRALGLPYKGYKKGKDALNLRRTILGSLETGHSVRIVNIGDYREMCMFSDDCLDSIVAALAAGLWATNPKLFKTPESVGLSSSDAKVQLEGWLYAPELPL